MNRYVESDSARKKSGPLVTGSRVRSVPPEDEDEFPDMEPEPEPERETPDRRGATKVLTMIQIIACAAVLAAAIALRLAGGELYRSVRDWYFTALNNSIVPDSQMESMKRTVLDLWSAISSPRAESSQPASSREQQSGVGNNNGAVSENQQSGNNNNAARQSQPAVSENNNAASQGAQSPAPGGGEAGENQAQPNAQSAASAAQDNANAPAGAPAP